MSPFERKFADYGLVDVSSIEPSIAIDIKYSTTDNFMGENMYGSLGSAWLVPELAEKVAAAQRELQGRYSGYSLVIFDAARPLSIQRRMYESVRGTDKAVYVADPDHEGGGFHNYGLAVDLSILDGRGNLLDMGTCFDYFGPESHVGDETRLLMTGKISREACLNRQLLYGLMAAHGMQPHPNEWWHYQHVQTEAGKRRYRLLDF